LQKLNDIFHDSRPSPLRSASVHSLNLPARKKQFAQILNENEVNDVFLLVFIQRVFDKQIYS
jgi:hypothetical protein